MPVTLCPRQEYVCVCVCNYFLSIEKLTRGVSNRQSARNWCARAVCVIFQHPPTAMTRQKALFQTTARTWKQSKRKKKSNLGHIFNVWSIFKYYVNNKVFVKCIKILFLQKTIFFFTQNFIIIKYISQRIFYYLKDLNKSKVIKYYTSGHIFIIDYFNKKKKNINVQLNYNLRKSAHENS